MRILLTTIVIIASLFNATAGTISGFVKDEKGHILPFASILVKGTPLGTTANNEGKYFLHLDPGKYVIIAQYVGYQRQEKEIQLGSEEVHVDFSLGLQNLSLKEVVVKPGAEDPAYEIIRNAIKKREYYRNQLDQFDCEVYTKGIFKLRDYPKKFFGHKVDFEDGDTSKKKILYLSESVSRYSFKKPDESKIEVLSTRVSGESGGFGLSAPQIISFYENILQIGSGLSPRGFISPIANNALSFYKYKYEGSFFEDGKEINRIKVIPKRKYEPVFSGYINITEGDWRIHSLQLMLTKESQMQILDTLQVEQLYVPFQNDVWVVKSQVIYPAMKIFGFDAYGNFVNVYSKFNIEPHFEKRFFNNTILKYNEGSNKKVPTYWDSIRPLPLLTEEVNDYHRKDSLEEVRRSPHYLDSLDKKNNKIKPIPILFTGQTISNSKKRSYIQVDPILTAIQFNTVEGWVGQLHGTWVKRLDSSRIAGRSISISPGFRYGFSNGHLNANLRVSYSTGSRLPSSFTISGGKWIYQLNNANPITPLMNSLSTLFYERNYMKIYEAWFGRLDYQKSLGEGLNIYGSLIYQDRIPLENTTDFTFKNSETREYTPNYPQDLMSENFQRHQAAIGIVSLSWKPGNRYIEFPDKKISIGSKYPTFQVSLIKGIHNFLGSDIDYTKWRFRISDQVNLKLFGEFHYNIVTGGFLQRDSVNVPDYQHFNGNLVALATPYLNSFQLLPYYKYSNTSSGYIQVNLEHHFNGMLTNKIPGFRTLNWHLVGGVNAFYVNENSRYVEPFVGLENIFHVLRLDMYWGLPYKQPSTTGLRIGITGFTGE